MEIKYDREAAVDYAKEWALSHNEHYKIKNGCGEGTSFASQCLYSGAGVMNTSREAGWYYSSEKDVSPSWTDSELLYKYLVGKSRKGPFAVQTAAQAACEGDLVQFGDCDGSFYHTAVITKIYGGKIFVCAHADNAYMRPVTSYRAPSVRFLHIIGTRI